MSLFGQSKRSKRLQNEAISLADKLQIPSMEAMRLVLEKETSAGNLSAEEAQTYLQDASAMEGFQTDPLVRQSQMDALQQLSDISERGLTETDKAALQKIQMGEDVRNRGAREAILNNARARGIGGSGLELAAQLQSQQAGATDESMRSQDIAAQSEQRALEALASMGQLGGQVRSQDLSEEATRAAAIDAINRFNTQNMQQNAQWNTQNRNAAAQWNMENQQNIRNQNAGIQNTQNAYNANLPQQYFQNQLAKLGQQTQTRMGAAASSDAAKQNALNMGTNILGGLIGAGATLGGATLLKK